MNVTKIIKPHFSNHILKEFSRDNCTNTDEEELVPAPEDSMVVAAVAGSVFWSVVKVLAKELSPDPTFLATLVNDPDSSGSLCFKLNLFLVETGVDDEFTTDFVEGLVPLC